MMYQAPVAEMLSLAEDVLMASSGSTGGGTGTTDPNPDIGSDTDTEYPSLPPDDFTKP
ncbi:MAG: hypothetical protein J6I45_11900 [Clostridia bacterium]|nr:hypothetical protein [Clostridia bacterium]MBQ8350571.1 hypothetical protein [Clostridia bacterium]